MAPVEPTASVLRIYLRTTADGIIRDSIVPKDVRADFALVEASPRGNLLALLGGVDNRLIAHVLRRDGTVADDVSTRPPGNGAWRWSAEGDAIYWTDRDSSDRRLLGWWRVPIHPVTGRRTGPAQPIALREPSQVGRFDVAGATGDMAIELSNRRHVIWLLTRNRSGYRTRLIRAATLPLYGALAPNGQEPVIGAASGDSTLTLSVMNLDTGREEAVMRLPWASPGFFEMPSPLRWADAGRIVLTRPAFNPQYRTEILLVERNGVVDTLGLTLTLGDVSPAPGGAEVYSDRPGRLIRLPQNGVADTLTFSDSVRTPYALGPVDRDRTLMFVADNTVGTDNILHLVDWRTRQTSKIATLPFDNGPVSLAAFGDTAFVALQATPGRVDLLAVPLRGGPPQAKAVLPTAGLEYPSIHFNSDRSRALLVGEEDFSDIWLLKGALPARQR